MAQAILRLPAVIQLTGLSRSSIYRLEAEGRFPRRVSLSNRAVGWVSDEIHEWIEQQIESGRNTGVA